MLEGDATDLFCFLSQSQVVEVLPEKPVSRIPFSPRHIRGVIPYSGTILPVIDLDVLCGAEEKEDAQYRQFVVVRAGASDQQSGEFFKVVIAVRTRILIERLASAELAALRAEREIPRNLPVKELLHGLFKQEDKYFLLFDFNKIALS